MRRGKYLANRSSLRSEITLATTFYVISLMKQLLYKATKNATYLKNLYGITKFHFPIFEHWICYNLSIKTPNQ